MTPVLSPLNFMMMMMMMQSCNSHGVVRLRKLKKLVFTRAILSRHFSVRPEARHHGNVAGTYFLAKLFH